MLSNRHLKRLTKEKKKEIDLKFNENLCGASDKQNCELHGNNIIAANSGNCSLEEGNINAEHIIDDSDVTTSHAPFKKKFTDWFLEFRPSHRCASRLLKILRYENLCVPRSATSLISEQQACVTRTVSPG